MQLIDLRDRSQAQRERLFYIDFRLYFLGTVTRNDLVTRFGIKEAAATRDITAYRQYKPGNIEYDTKVKIYCKRAGFEPLFEYTPTQALTALTQGIGDDVVGIHKPLIYCDTPVPLNLPSVKALAVLSTAIHQEKAVHLEYCSVSSGLSSREFVPFALVDNGLRWHVRGYDRKNGRFGDFVLTRITEVKPLTCKIKEDEKREADIQWNRIVEMEIVPHPNRDNLEHPEAIELDYGMIDGVLKVNVRAAVAGYVLRRWNVDCTGDHHLEGKEYHLWLQNTPALYGVDNLNLAPGYEQS